MTEIFLNKKIAGEDGCLFKCFLLLYIINNDLNIFKQKITGEVGYLLNCFSSLYSTNKVIMT